MFQAFYQLPFGRIIARGVVATVAWVALGGLWTPVSAAQQPGTVYAGTTTQVSLGGSNILATCNPPIYYTPSGPDWSIAPSSVQVGAATGQQLIDGATVSVTVPSYQESGGRIFIGWTGLTECVSYNGYVYIDVLPPLTDAQVKTVNKAGRQVEKEYKLAKRFDRADTGEQKRKLVAKDEKLDKQAKKTVKEWREDKVLPTNPSEPGAAEPYRLHDLFEALGLFTRGSVVLAADCLFEASGGKFCRLLDDACTPYCAVSPIGSPGRRVLVERPLLLGRPCQAPAMDDRDRSSSGQHRLDGRGGAAAADEYVR
jgi:hypothetical protein